MNLRELNYILIPRSPDTLDRLSSSRLARLLSPVFAPFRALTREGQTLSVALLITGLAGVDIHFSHLYLVFCSLAGLLMAGFALRPLARMKKVAVRVEHAPRVAVNEAATFTVVVSNHGDAPVYAVRARGPFLPWDGEWRSRRPAVSEIAAGGEARLSASAAFICRGDKLLGRFWITSVRPLGLVMGNRLYTERIRLHVVPRVVEVDGLPPPPPASTRPDPPGLGRGTGDSFELLGLRPYRIGDRIRDLHARSWARLGEPMVREYQVPDRPRLGVLLHCASDGKHREELDAACGLAASLVKWGLDADAVVELLVAAETVEPIVVGAEIAAFEAGLDALAAVEAVRTAPEAATHATACAGRVGALCLVFPAWGPEQAEVVRSARTLAPDARAFVVQRKPAPEAEAMGVKVLPPGALDADRIFLG